MPNLLFFGLFAEGYRRVVFWYDYLSNKGFQPLACDYCKIVVFNLYNDYNKFNKQIEEAKQMNKCIDIKQHSEAKDDVGRNEKRVETEKHQNFLFPFSFSHFPSCRPAMTLAEVLITLGIIGIVAAMTLPVLINNIQDAHYKTAYKKAYSDASNIWQSMRLNNEIEPCISTNSQLCTDKNLVTVRGYMKTIKTCGDTASFGNSVKECWDISGENYYQVASGGTNSAPKFDTGMVATGFIDSSGRSWVMVPLGFLGREVLIVDTNGFKEPNRFGKDRFPFQATNQDGSFGYGINVKLTMPPDRSTIATDCGYPPCLFKSWLSQ